MRDLRDPRGRPEGGRGAGSQGAGTARLRPAVLAGGGIGSLTAPMRASTAGRGAGAGQAAGRPHRLCQVLPRGQGCCDREVCHRPWTTLPPTP